MRKAGFVVLDIGLLITLFTGFKFITREKVVDVGEIQITRDKANVVSWSPLIGVAVMAIGGVMLLLGPKS